MVATREDLPEDIEALRAALLAERARAARVEAELAVARAMASDDTALIAHQRLQIEKLTRQLYGQHSERTVRLIDQMELAFEELESSASEDEIAAERATAKTTNVVAFTRRRPAYQVSNSTTSAETPASWPRRTSPLVSEIEASCLAEIAGCSAVSVRSSNLAKWPFTGVPIKRRRFPMVAR